MNPKTVLITGASRGIGKAAAIEFAKHGCRLYLTCQSSMDALLEFSGELTAGYGIQCTPIQADMGCYEDVEKVFAQLTDLDILINNAGISYIGLLSDMTPEEWQRVMNVNLNSCFYTSKLAIPLFLKKHQGRIINISSVWGNVGASMEAAYSASKGGVGAFTKALAKELAPSNIQVNAVAFGAIDTSMNSCFSEESIAALIEEIPANRLGTPAEAAEMIYLLSQAPAYLTGQVIAMDGGWI
ncbi:MAG: SDR family NAD(P)-dependent oxidoreductase [Lachnoclostridium sp.]|nr:SDR family NAD(P)-dependent oxidoreductase [Lachnospira sp.]MCM1249040.1 SDR family NAD(P)-dependent oxidoreductase [Lachnoclostridium sp.]